MIYSAGFDLHIKNTGVEKAQFNRHRLFKQCGIASKLLYTRYNPSMYSFAKRHGLQHEYISMYDYLQGSIDVHERQFDWLDYWKNVRNYAVEKIDDTLDVRVYKDKQFIMYASFFDEEYKLIRYINHFDKNRTKVMREVYDWRGFLSVKYYLMNNVVFFEQYYSPDGEVRIEKFKEIKEGKSLLRKIIVKDANHQMIHLNSEYELRAYFFDEIYRVGDIFIIDRPLENGYAIVLSKHKIPAYIFMHTTHFKDMTDIRDNIFKPTFHSTFQYAQYFKGIIVSTDEQKIDVENVVKDKTCVYAIPVGYIGDEKLRKLKLRLQDESLNGNRRKLKLLSFGRYELVKQLDHQIEIVAKLVDEFPQLELQMYGFGGREDELKQLVQKLNMQNHIFINKFTLKVEEKYKDAILSLSTSYMEGFSLSIQESLANGVPVIAYDVKYGPGYLIEHGKNGELIPLNDKQALYEAVRSYLLDHQKQERYRQNCLTYLNKCSARKVADAWINLLIDEKNSLSKGERR